MGVVSVGEGWCPRIISLDTGVEWAYFSTNVALSSARSGHKPGRLP